MAVNTILWDIGNMRTTLPRLLVANVLAVSAHWAFPLAALAQAITAPPIPGASPQARLPLGDQQIQESINRREAYQQLQQLQRQQDRDATRYRPERLEVPVMKPSCTSSVHAGSLSTGCR